MAKTMRVQCLSAKSDFVSLGYSTDLVLESKIDVWLLKHPGVTIQHLAQSSYSYKHEDHNCIETIVTIMYTQEEGEET